MALNLLRIVVGVFARVMLSLMTVGSLIINTMSFLLLLSQLLGQNIARMLGMTDTTAPQLKSFLEMEEWLQSSIGTNSSNSRTSSPEDIFSDCEPCFCMVSEDNEDFCGELAVKAMRMPFEIPNMPMCEYHCGMFENWTHEDTIGELVEMMTEEESMNNLKEELDDDL
jgi:hypothetical protein